MNWELLLQLIVNGLILGTLYGVVAMCFTLIYKASQVVNFAQGEFLLIGAWVCWWLLADLQLPFWAGLPDDARLHDGVRHPPAGGGAAADDRRADHLGDHGDDRPVDLLPGDHEVDLRGRSCSRSRRSSRPTRSASSGLNVQPAYLMSLVVSLAIMGGFALFFKYSRLGLAMRATAFNQQVAQSLGISVQKMFALSWAISAMVSALAGVVFGIVNGVSSALSLFGIKVFPAVILGGLDSIVGAIVGGLIIGLLENLAEYVDGQWLNIGNLYNIAPFYVLVIILMIRPYGLFGTEKIERV